jgi:probable rRNA maturation factor
MPDLVILNRQRRHPVRVPSLKRFLLRLCLRLGIADKEFAVFLTNDRTIRRFNRRYRGHDKATDVLSFATHRLSGPSWGFEKDYLGDIIISVERARHQAVEEKRSLHQELRILLIHGLLHLLGHDHESDRGQMRRKELRLQKDLL